jgi:hypothetical protein
MCTAARSGFGTSSVRRRAFCGLPHGARKKRDGCQWIKSGERILGASIFSRACGWAEGIQVQISSTQRCGRRRRGKRTLDVHDNEHSGQFLLFSSRVLGCRLLRHPAPVRGAAVSTTTRSPIGAKTAIITGRGIDIGLSSASAFAFAEAGYHDRYGCPAGEQRQDPKSRRGSPARSATVTAESLPASPARRAEYSEKGVDRNMGYGMDRKRRLRPGPLELTRGFEAPSVRRRVDRGRWLWSMPTA